MISCRALAAASALVMAGGCAVVAEQPVEPAARNDPATAVKATVARPVRRTGDDRPETYLVQRGDTLFSIALDFGFDYRELASWNGLSDPSRILAGQVLRLRPAEVPPIAAVQVKPVADPGAIAVESLGSSAAPLANTPSPATSAVAPSSGVVVLAEPRAVTLAYSPAALARLGRATTEDSRKTPQGADATARPSASADAADDESLEWTWPVRGDLLYRFGDAGRPKGIGIGGRPGQPVGAAAPGRVVYSGTGLRGYGKLVIVKHNDTYLSVYAHNSAIFVKEGDVVQRGQKIAGLGDTDAAQVGLHFEMRRFGRPIDPVGRLPP